MEENALLSSQIIEDIHGIVSVKSMGVEQKLYKKLDSKFIDTLKAGYKYNLAMVTQNTMKDITELIITLSILYFGALMAIKGQITLGQLIAFNSLMGYFLGPIEAVVNLQGDLQNAKVANSRLNQVLLSPLEKEKNKSLIDKNDSLAHIVLSNVSFEYKYGQKTLKKINLDIPCHKATAIVGLSGSGKTTLAKLLVNFYTPTTGKIEIDGQDISEINKKSLRNFITYLPQNPYIFSGSVSENIAMGSKKPSTMASIMNAAKIAEIHEDIEKLPDGYSTYLSEDSGLSGGQMQRIAIARAVLGDSKIIILDESTSNLDLLTEKKVINNLMNMKKKTLIFIAHRLEVARRADSVIVMNNGRVLEQGSHQELLQMHGAYYKLVEE